MMKLNKMLASTLVFTMIICNSNLALANDVLSSNNDLSFDSYDYISTEETVLISFDEYSKMTRSLDEIITTVVEDDDGGHEIYTYQNGELIQKVYGGIYAAEIITQNFIDGKLVSESRLPIDVETIATPSTRSSYVRKGYIEYQNPWTSQKLGINLFLNENTMTKSALLKMEHMHQQH